MNMHEIQLSGASGGEMGVTKSSVKTTVLKSSFILNEFVGA